MEMDSNTMCGFKCTDNGRLKNIVATVVILLNVACITWVSYMMANSNKKTIEAPTHPCVDCSLLKDRLSEAYVGLLLTKLSRSKDTGGREKCCAENSEQTSALLEAVLDVRFNKYEPVTMELPAYNVSHFTYSPASAHIRLRPSVEYETTDETIPQFPNNSYVPLKLDLARTSQVWEHVRNVQILSTGIKVTHPGLYYVYSCIRFNPDSSKPCGDYDQQTWEHHVIRSRPEDRQSTGVLLRTLHTCCDTCVREKSTSYAGGVFYLDAGDHLSVEVSGYALIRFDRDASYIGLYMLGV